MSYSIKSATRKNNNKTNFLTKNLVSKAKPVKSPVFFKTTTFDFGILSS